MLGAVDKKVFEIMMDLDRPFAGVLMTISEFKKLNLAACRNVFAMSVSRFRQQDACGSLSDLCFLFRTKLVRYD